MGELSWKNQLIKKFVDHRFVVLDETNDDATIKAIESVGETVALAALTLFEEMREMSIPLRG